MASITKRENGRWELHYQDADDRRQTIRFGRIPERTARSWKLKIEDLIAASFGGTIKDETAKWIEKIPLPLAKKLHRKGLIESRVIREEEMAQEAASREASRVRLKPFLEEYVAHRKDVKPRTVAKYRSTIEHLIIHFGPGHAIHDLTEADADAFRIYLSGQGLSENTIRKHSQLAKQFFNYATKRRILERNPFRELKGSAIANHERFHFVEEAVAKKILNALPCNQWKLIFALCRWGGLRCPSEVFSLTWQDVDWDRERIKVTSPKTAHHAGKGSREIPLFPELKPLLEKGFELAAEGETFVITKYRSQDQNLRTRLAVYIRDAGFDPWPKLFQNLRSTRETELTQRFPIHVVCKWIGNSEAVASKHYLQVTDTHFEQALESAEKTQQYPQQSVQEIARNPATEGKTREQKTKEIVGCLKLSDSKVAETGLEPARE